MGAASRFLVNSLHSRPDSLIVAAHLTDPNDKYVDKREMSGMFARTSGIGDRVRTHAEEFGEFANAQSRFSQLFEEIRARRHRTRSPDQTQFNTLIFVGKC